MASPSGRRNLLQPYHKEACMALYESRTELRCSPQRAFEFLIRPANMQSVAPPELGMVFVNPPEVIALGSKLIFKVQAHGFVQQIEHEVTRSNRSPASAKR